MAKHCFLVFIFMLSLHYFMACNLVTSRTTLASDQSSLLAFKSSMNLDLHDLLATNWSNSFSLCNWIGITCDVRHGRVKALNLSNMGLTGIIPPELGNLSFLSELDLSYNYFRGELPDELQRLHRVKLLNLSYNRFNGEFPIWIGSLYKLQHLSLQNNSFGGFIPPSISNLSKLETLDLNSNNIGGRVPFEISKLCQLRTFSIAMNKLSGSIPTEIFNVSLLEIVILAHNSFTGEIPFSLFNMSSLRKVSLESNNLHGSLPQEMCSHLPQLEFLFLSNNLLEGNMPKQIHNCTLLKELDLAKNSFTGSISKEIGVLNDLEVVDLEENYLRGSIPWNIFNMSSLKYLYLSNNSLSGSLPSDLGCGLPNLEKLHLHLNKLVGKVPNSISNASKLHDLELTYNEFSGAIPRTFGNLRNLVMFSVAWNNFTIDAHTFEMDFLTSLTNCRQLKYVQISFNSFHGKLPKSIGNFSNSLQHFLAASCKIEGNIPLEIGNLTDLIQFNVVKNDLSGYIPKTINGLKSLQWLGLGINALRGFIIDELCEISRLYELFLNENKFSGVIPTCIGNLTTLRYLYVDSNNLVNEIPSSLWTLKDILEVYLSSNALTGFLPYEISNLKALTILDLSGNKLSGNIPTAISDLKNLITLSLAHNRLEGSIPESLGEMVSLESLDLSQNDLSGMIPKSLELLLSLQFINLSYNKLEGEIPSGGSFKNFRAQSFMHNKALCGNPRLKVFLCSKEMRNESSANLILLKILLPTIVLTVSLVSCMILVLWKRQSVGNPPLGDLSTLGVPRISYYELLNATNGFDESNLLGNGSFGSVYKGVLSSGMIVAIKVLNMNSEATSKSFDVECNAMQHLRHRNLIKIISTCSNIDFKALIMEFMPNGSVDKWLYSHNYFLDFLQRLNIMIDVAFALEYLHHGSSIAVVHCDIKPSNILLDENIVAHVSDFGIAKLFDEVQSKTFTNTLATLGYIAPEYGSEGVISIRGDVYSYGILILEMFTRKKPIDDMFTTGLDLKSWVIYLMPNVTHIIDSNLLQQNGQLFNDIITCTSAILELALNCCADLPEARISMTDVVASLNKIKMLFLQKARSMAT